MARPKRVPISPRLVDHRRRLGLTQEQVAERLGITAEMVRRHERGLQTPSPRYRAQYCILFGADEVALGLRPPIRPSNALTVSNASADVPEDENVSAIFARVRKLQSRSVGTSALSVLEASVDDFVERYEHEGPKPLVAPLVKQRQALDMMIEECAHPVERLRLYRLAGRTSGLLAYMAVNRSRYSIARAYCSEAFALAEYANDHELQAWVRGTQSFCEYYAGDYQAAVDLARDGQRYAMDGPQAVRLAINGEARALGKLGDTAGVHVAVQRGYDLLDRNAPVNGVSPCISFGGYSLARAASNAVTAYVDLGAPTDAATHAEVAMPEFDISDSRWSKSLIRLDLAKAMALHRDGDPDEAASLVSKALDFSSGIPITSVVQRSRDFLHVSAKRWKDARAVVDLRDAVSSTQLA